MNNALVTGASIRHVRKGLGLSGREVAKRAGISAPYLCDIEMGNRHAPIKTLEGIRRALGKARIVESHRACPTCQGIGAVPVPIFLGV